MDICCATPVICAGRHWTSPARNPAALLRTLNSNVHVFKPATDSLSRSTGSKLWSVCMGASCGILNEPHEVHTTPTASDEWRVLAVCRRCSYQDEIKQRCLVHLDELCVPLLDIIFTLCWLIIYFPVCFYMEPAVLDDLGQDLARYIGQGDDVFGTGICT